MKYNEEEAKRAMDCAEGKLSENDYNGAKKFVDKAQNLYPNLDGLKQVVTMIDVYISATNKINGEADWYAILGVDPLADDEAVKKQYKNLALLLHPDKNRFNGAEGAFKLVLQAWDLLSDKAKRSLYDQKRKSKLSKHKKSRMNKQPKPPEYKYRSEFGSESESEPEYEHEPGYENEPNSSWKQENSRKPEKVSTFRTMCKNNRCNAQCEFVRSSYLNKTRPCPNCRQDFVATEILPKIINGRQVFSCANFQSTSSRTSDASSSTTSPSDSKNQAQ